MGSLADLPAFRDRALSENILDQLQRISSPRSSSICYKICLETACLLVLKAERTIELTAALLDEARQTCGLWGACKSVDHHKAQEQYLSQSSYGST